MNEWTLQVATNDEDGMPGQAEYLQDSGPGPKAHHVSLVSSFSKLRQLWANMGKPNIQVCTSPMFAAALADRFDRFDRFGRFVLYWLGKHFG